MKTNKAAENRKKPHTELSNENKRPALTKMVNPLNIIDTYLYETRENVLFQQKKQKIRKI